jgi:outer membrane protein OmpA-like peptidoglycan-associated protein
MWLLLTTCALAQEGGFDAHGFRFLSPDADPRDPLEFVRPGETEPLQWSLGAMAEYASRPLRFELEDGTEVTPLQNLVAVNVAGSFVPIDRVRIDLSMPAYLTTSDDAGTDGPAPGDLRTSLLLVGLEPSQASGFGLGLVASLDAPTGTPDRWLGTVGPAGAVGMTSTVEIEDYTFSWMGGGRFAPNSDPDARPTPTRGGDAVEAAASLGMIVSKGLGMGVEGRVSFPVEEAVRTAIGIPATAVATFRYATESGGYVSGGVGTGLGFGAGASPIRVVVGGGFGGKGQVANKDIDADGFVDSADGCPEEAETPNQYKDEDGCPDALPQIEFVARREDREENAAAIVVDRPDKTTSQGIGKLMVGGQPGQLFVANAKVGACYGGRVEARTPEEGRIQVTVPIGRLDAEVVVTVTDAGGRPLDGAVARYIVEEEDCAPRDTTLVAGKGVHVVGSGPTTVFVTAPGYGVHQVTLTPPPGERTLVDAKLSPTQVSLREGVFQLAKPIDFRSGTAVILDSALPIVGQVASLMLSNDGQRFEISAWAPAGANAKRLSQQRAEAVVAALVERGVPPDVLTGVGQGTLLSKQSESVRVKVAP